MDSVLIVLLVVFFVLFIVFCIAVGASQEAAKERGTWEGSSLSQEDRPRAEKLVCMCRELPLDRWVMERSDYFWDGGDGQYTTDILTATSPNGQKIRLERKTYRGRGDSEDIESDLCFNDVKVCWYSSSRSPSTSQKKCGYTGLVRLYEEKKTANPPKKEELLTPAQKAELEARAEKARQDEKKILDRAMDQW